MAAGILKNKQGWCAAELASPGSLHNLRVHENCILTKCAV